MLLCFEFGGMLDFEEMRESFEFEFVEGCFLFGEVNWFGDLGLREGGVFCELLELEEF